MSLINVNNLTFAYDGSYEPVFENVSFQFDTDWKLGFTGRNGKGKTTFLNLLRGQYEYTGSIDANVKFDYFPYNMGNINAPYMNTIDIINGFNSDYEHWKLLRELSLLEVDEETLYRSFDTLSNGEQTKILLAVLFLKENNFLLIDEPTNHLDAAGREKVSAYLKSKKGFILVSHDRVFLDNCIDHILSINKNSIEIQRGNFSSWLINKERSDNFELTQNEKLQKDVKRLTEAAKRTSDWSDKLEKTKYKTKNSGLRPDRGYIGHKSAKMMKRAKAAEARRDSAALEKSKLLKNVETADSLKLYPVIHHTKKLMTLDKLSVFYGEKCVCENISFTVENGDRIALKGRNGSGKSSILKLICGEELRFEGNLHIASNLKISYVGQETGDLKGSLSEYAEKYNISESLFKAILSKLDFSRTQFEKDMSDFSGGQKKKTFIARSLCEKAHLYIWDEPLNYIDVISRMQIEELLLAFKPTILFAEHDAAFCDKIASKTVEI
ncbi:MAG: ABC-F type ribosomal protection protein [Oscillospiraceae bacterium]|nr:ABC-F type ribosomal protection protein [Oscillospiraceae bacterium]